MSMPSRAAASTGCRAVVYAGTVADHAGQSSRYLTDGVNLYRFLGAIASGTSEMVGLENCHSPDVMPLSIEELRARRLRAVIPAGGE
jgi:hypothetical protein